jgi:hypothetical protein
LRFLADLALFGGAIGHPSRVCVAHATGGLSVVETFKPAFPK